MTYVRCMYKYETNVGSTYVPRHLRVVVVCPVVSQSSHPVLVSQSVTIVTILFTFAFQSVFAVYWNILINCNTQSTYSIRHTVYSIHYTFTFTLTPSL